MTRGGHETVIAAVSAGLGLMALGVVAFFFAQRWGGFRMIERGLLKLAENPSWKGLAGAANLHDRIELIHDDIPRMTAAFVLHLVMWFVGALEIWVALTCMGIETDMAQALVIEVSATPFGLPDSWFQARSAFRKAASSPSARFTEFRRRLRSRCRSSSECPRSCWDCPACSIGIASKRASANCLIRQWLHRKRQNRHNNCRNPVYAVADRPTQVRPRQSAEERRGTSMLRATFTKRGLIVAALGLAIISASAPWSGPALAAGDPASARIDAFYAALLDAMKNAKTLGVKGRYDKLAPVVAKTFDVAGMAKGAVGAGWDSIRPRSRRRRSRPFSA